MNTTKYNINFFKLKISTERKGEKSARSFQDFGVSNGQQFSFSYRKYQMSCGYFYPSYKYDFSEARPSSEAPSQVSGITLRRVRMWPILLPQKSFVFLQEKQHSSSSSTDVLFYTSSIILFLKSLLSQNLADCFLFLFSLCFGCCNFSSFV